MTLSVLVPTREPASRVAALLAPLRDSADEIVVGVDDRIPRHELGGYQAIADRLVRFEHSGSDRGLAWLHAQCSGEWILLLAGDELVSTELAHALPSLCSEPDIRQYSFPTRWTWPDGSHWLDELPWWPDFHNRLVRNDEALWFEGRIHTGARRQLPMRHVEAPIYHLALAMTTLEHRQDRVHRYETTHSGLQAHGGGGLNERLYLPERFARRAPVKVPDADRRLVADVLEARDGGRPQPVMNGPVPVARRAEIDAVWDGRELEAPAYQAGIELFERDLRIPLGEQRPVFVKVRNQGTAVWPGGADLPPEIRISYHWHDAAGNTVVHDGLRSRFPAPLAPGAAAVLPVLVRAPDTPGEHVLVFDLVHEHVRWFGCETAVAMTVEGDPAPRHRRRWWIW